jgi:alpha-L-fucosidase
VLNHQSAIHFKQVQIVEKTYMPSSNTPVAFGATPTRNQLAWQEMGAYAFIHFTVNTFTDYEWGEGTEDPSVFNPSELDCEQWCRVVSQAGFKGIVLTAKHHDGFCLWPSKFTKHTVASSRWRDGQGDVVGDLAKAAKKFGLKLGLYLSPWDRHEPSYGSGEDYNKFYRNQLRELLTTYGGKNGEDIFMTWFDGACGEGPNGKVQTYDYDKATAVIHECAPQAVIMGHMGDHRDVRWCGNERGYAGSPNWATLDKYEFEHLNNGDPNGRHWWPSEVDVSIRPGWFYHAHEDAQVHSLEHLLDIWYHSVGRGSCLHLNFPPDRRGLIHEQDAERSRELKLVIDKTFAEDFALHGQVSASDERGADFAGAKLTDGSSDTFWAPNDETTQCEAIVELGQLRKLNVIKLREYTQLGQRVAAFELDYRDAKGDWQLLIADTTISFRKIVRTPTVETTALRLRVTESLACPCLQEFGAYYQAPVLFAPHIQRDLAGMVSMCAAAEVNIHYTSDGSTPSASSPRYTAPFSCPDAGEVRAIALPLPGMKNHYPEIRTNPEAYLRFGVARAGWSVLSADSEQDEEFRKENIIAADTSLWLTGPDDDYPHQIVIDTGKKRTINGFILTPPTMSECGMGAVASYRFYVSGSADGAETLAAEGSFDNLANNPVPQYVTLKTPVEGRVLRLEGLTPAKKTCRMAVKSLEVF